MLTGALGDPLTRIIVLFAEQILKKTTPIGFAPLIISEDTRDIRRCPALMELRGRSVSRTAPSLLGPVRGVAAIFFFII